MFTRFGQIHKLIMFYVSQVFSLSEKKVKNMQSKDYEEPCVEFPAFQWFGLYGSTAGGTGLIPVQETKIPPCPVTQLGKKTKQNNRTLWCWFHV